MPHTIANPTNIQSFVLDTTEITTATGVTQNNTVAFVFPEDRNIIGFEHRLGYFIPTPVLAGVVIEAISEISRQAVGLVEGVIDTLSNEAEEVNLIAAPASAAALSEIRVKEKTIWAPSGYAWVFERGESINILLWTNNQTGGNMVTRAYVIFYYEDMD